MVSNTRGADLSRVARLSTHALIDLSLRNHLCFHALRTEHGTAFHLGTIVRTMFASFYLFDAGFGKGELSVFSTADVMLGELALRARANTGWSMKSDLVPVTARLLELYDNQLQTAPLDELVAAHQRAEGNFSAPPHERLSIAALIQRSKRSRPNASARW